MTDSREFSIPYLAALKVSDDPGPGRAGMLKSLREASAAGDVRAKYALATWHLHGMEDVVERDVARAFEMLKDLEGSFIAEALFDLAIFYDLGELIEADENKAFSLYMRSALLGNRESCGQMAEFFREGKVVEHDEMLQRAWLKRAEQKEVDISPPYRVWLRPQS